MKHKHYDMIVAKAANTELVKFVKHLGEWIATQTDEWNIASDYFLCLPKHKEACLHWLNGGDVISANTDARDGSINPYGGKWSSDCYFMNEFHNLRIKPKKEKRWIVYRNGNVYGEYLSVDSINDDFKSTGQVIEIEVEV